MGSYRVRRTIIIIVSLLIIAVPASSMSVDFPTLRELLEPVGGNKTIPTSLADLSVKGRAPKTGYERSEFGNGWDSALGCDTRNTILSRDMTDVIRDDKCRVVSGTLNDPYTSKRIVFVRGETTSDDVQIDHVVALSNAWQTGAQLLDYETRVRFANDPLNLLAVEGTANEQKSDADAATWLPPNKPFRCQYVERQISVKSKYGLWVTSAERDAMSRVLNGCSAKVEG